MGDFFKGSDFTDMPEELVRHLRLHRHVDTFTRRSRSFQNSRRMLHPRFRHGRSVLVDVFYDHFLACNWNAFTTQPLAEFSREVYRGLESCADVLSPGLQRQLPRMIEYDWLTSYRRPEVVGRVLTRLEERIGGRLPLAAGFLELERCRDGLEKDFFLFMEEVQVVAETWKRHH